MGGRSCEKGGCVGREGMGEGGHVGREECTTINSSMGCVSIHLFQMAVG